MSYVTHPMLVYSQAEIRKQGKQEFWPPYVKEKIQYAENVAACIEGCPLTREDCRDFDSFRKRCKEHISKYYERSYGSLIILPLLLQLILPWVLNWVLRLLYEKFYEPVGVVYDSNDSQPLEFDTR